MERNRKKIIAVDFDGTLVENKWPQIGATNHQVLEYCKDEQKNGTRIILWTSRVGGCLDEAVDWCKENGLTLNAINENLPEVIEEFGHDPRKIYADEYIDDKATTRFLLPFESELSEVGKWAEEEVARACAAERASAEQPEDAEYGVYCYESALKAYRTLLDDDHSGASVMITKSILNRLIDGKCLTPIEDTPDIWNFIYERDGEKHYQCKRMSSLFKHVDKDGGAHYEDIDRVIMSDIETMDLSYRDMFGMRLVDTIFPITMPYLPFEKSFKIVREEFLFDPKNGEYDTVAYLYILTPSGKKIELDRYFKEENSVMIPIEKEEFEERKAKKIEPTPVVVSSEPTPNEE